MANSKVPRTHPPSENRRKAAVPVGRRFQPGQSGNPGGRKKLTPEQKQQELDLVRACREKSLAALAVIESLMHTADRDSTRLAAAQFVIERGWGKAVQPVAGDGDGNPIQHSLEVRFV